MAITGGFSAQSVSQQPDPFMHDIVDICEIAGDIEWIDIAAARRCQIVAGPGCHRPVQLARNRHGARHMHRRRRQQPDLARLGFHDSFREQEILIGVARTRFQSQLPWVLAHLGQKHARGLRFREGRATQRAGAATKDQSRPGIAPRGGKSGFDAPDAFVGLRYAPGPKQRRVEPRPQHQNAIDMGRPGRTGVAVFQIPCQRSGKNTGQHQQQRRRDCKKTRRPVPAQQQRDRRGQYQKAQPVAGLDQHPEYLRQHKKHGRIAS